MGLTAIQWVSQSKLTSTYVSSMEEALARARSILADQGFEVPAELKTG